MVARKQTSMSVLNVGISHGATPVGSRQAGGVPGPLPRMGPPLATGGTSASTCGVRSREQRKLATDRGKPLQLKTLNILQWNAEGIWNKKEALKNRLDTCKIDIACIQETHLTDKNRFSIRGYQTVRQDRLSGSKGGVLILVKNDINISEMKLKTEDDSEMIGIKLSEHDPQLIVYNCYCPPLKSLSLEKLEIPEEGCIVTGDFNSHSQSWGYRETDARGEEVESWQIDTKLILLNHPDDPPTFYSRRWRTTTTPDLGFATDDIAKCASRTVQDQLAGSDHRPVLLKIDMNIQRMASYAPPRWNFKKANWDDFSMLTDTLTSKINVRTNQLNKSVKQFTEAILQAAKESIPRGSRKQYIPYWSDELKELHEEVSAARNKTEMDPTVENNIALNAASAKYRRETIAAIRKAWHEKTASLDFDKSGRKLWNLTKSLNGEPNRNSPLSITMEDKVLTGKKAANHLIKEFSEISNIPINNAQRKAVKKMQQKQRLNLREPEDEVMTAPITIDELDANLKELKTKKAPGPDNVPNDLLINLGPQAKRKLLGIFNTSWKTGTLPGIWKRAVLIPILKKGKSKDKADSYRPISLTSCICKLMERIINRRLMWYLEDNKLIMDEQAGFRQHRSTEDQIAYISQVVEEGFQKQHHTVVIWVDMEKAFDKIWREGLIMKLLDAKVSHKMLKWIEHYLQQRSGRVRLNGKESRQEAFKHGVPQGGVLSPTLFTLFMNSIREILDPRIKAAMYADDLAIISSEKEIGTAKARLQTCLERLEKWMEDWAMNINASKTTYTIFTLSPKLLRLKLKIRDKWLEREDNPRYLGITFDPRLTWKKHLEETQTKGVRRTALLKKTGWNNMGSKPSSTQKDICRIHKTSH